MRTNGFIGNARSLIHIPFVMLVPEPIVPLSVRYDEGTRSRVQCKGFSSDAPLSFKRKISLRPWRVKANMTVLYVRGQSGEFTLRLVDNRTPTLGVEPRLGEPLHRMADIGNLCLYCETF